MRRRDEGDEADFWPRDGGEVGDVAGLARAHLEHRVFGVGRHRQQGQGQADLVVVVAGVDVGAAVARQDRRQQRLDRGLAVGAGNADHARVTAPAHGPRNLAQGLPGVGHHDLGQVERELALDQQCRGAVGAGIGGEIMAVVALAAQGHEQGCRHRLARIDRNGVDADVAPVQATAGPVGNVGEAAAQHGRASSAVRATARSSNGRRTPAVS